MEGLKPTQKILSQFHIHLCLKNWGGEEEGGAPPPPRGSEPLCDKFSFTCNGSQRANVKDTNDIDFHFDEQPFCAVYRWKKPVNRHIVQMITYYIIQTVR